MSDNNFARRIRLLIAGLTERTEGGELKWEEVDNDRFEYTLTKSAVQVRSKDKDGLFPFYFHIYDENGRMIETIFDSGESAPPLELDKLYNAAARSQRGVDEKITEILNELAADDPPF